ncbi:MAG: L-ribulose-5-phosphate 4-epimerase AraD [Ignavibacteriaceae bacterium]
MRKFDKLKERVWRCNLELVNHNLVIHTFGNVSGIDRKESVVAIKPSGIPYNKLKKDDIVLVDLNNSIVEGELKPSIDTKTHTLLYKTFPHIGGIAHTHSTYATAWAQANKPIPCLGTTHADFIQSQIPCTDELSIEQIKGDYEIETGNQIIKKISNNSPLDIQMILVSGHGPFSWGKSPEEALTNTIVLEEIAKITLLTLNINPNIASLNRHILDKHYHRKHGKNAYYGQN